MQTSYKTEDGQVYFLLSEVEPAYRDAVRVWAEDRHGGELKDGHFFGRFPANSLFLDTARQGFTRYAPDMFAQMSGLQPFDWERSLEAFLQRVQEYDIDWWLPGSVALAVRGIDVAPHDIDIATDDKGAYTLATLLQDVLVEPLEDSHGWISNWFGRSFLHGRVEWVGGIDPSVDEPVPVDFGPRAMSHLERVTWRGHELRVPPLDLQLLVSERRGLTERAEKIRRYMTR